MKQENKIFSIKCQCSAYRNGIVITQKKKNKFVHLALDITSKSIKILPINSKQEIVSFDLKKLKHIHQKFVQEGKITLQFSQDSQNPTIKKSSQIGQAIPQRFSQIFVQSASYENLKLMIQKIVDFKKLMKKQSKGISKEKIVQKKQLPHNNQSKNINKKNSYEKPQLFTENMQQRKKDPLQYNKSMKQFQKQKQMIKIDRKSMMRSINQTHSKKSQTQTQHCNSPLRKQIDILQLPWMLLQKILDYTKLQLSHRLISKKFSEFTLRNISSISFLDEVDQVSFNKLAKYAPTIKGRLKNIRQLQLIDRHDQPQLLVNRAKSLYFGNWKQMSKKNIQQIKGLRLYLLELPYQIKFQIDNIYGIKLKQLHFLSKTSVTTPNFNIKQENILYLFKHVKQLQSFSIPYICSSTLQEIQKNTQKTLQITSLNIGTINVNNKNENWFIFKVFENLKKLSIDRVMIQQSQRSDLSIQPSFPLYLQDLSLGDFVTKKVISELPGSLKKLKISGQKYLNSDLVDTYLPYLKVLDISECTRVRPSIIQILSECNNLRIITNWERQDIDYWGANAKAKGIQICTIRANRR